VGGPGPAPGRRGAAGGRPRCAVLGSPIGHSLSPVLHRAAYAALGLDWRYDAVEVTEEGLAGFLGSLGPDWRGLSLTMPLKRAVVPLLDEVSDGVARAGAANTVVLGGGRRSGHNTDVPGAAAALDERHAGPVRSATVLGGGATAASLLHALADRGCRRATLLVREPRRAEETLAAVARHPRPPEVTVGVLGGPAPDPADVLASTIPAAAQDPWVTGLAERSAVVFEALYDPWPTPLAAEAVRLGLPLVGGLDLLVHQAVLQVGLMTGERLPVLEAMRSAGEAALAARAERRGR
jgi:shikimate dehydrogenase